MILELGMVEKYMELKYKGEIHAVMCFAYTNKIPKSVDELEKLSTDAFLQSAHERSKWRSNSNCLYSLV